MNVRINHLRLAAVDGTAVPTRGRLAGSVMVHLRELVLATGADEEEASVILIVMGRLEEIQRTRGVAAAEAAARAFKALWLEA
jgi:hypothetical protein